MRDIDGRGSSATSALTYYTSRSAFDAAEPGLPLEDFHPISAPAVIDAPLSSRRNNSDFPVGDILPGITLRNQLKGDTPGLYVFDGAVGSFYFEDPLVLSFAPGVKAVATDAFASSGGASAAGTFTASIYGGSTLLGRKTFHESAGGTGFVGFSSTQDITRVVIAFQPSADVDAAPFVDDIAFGSPAPSPGAAADRLAAAMASFGATPGVGHLTPFEAKPVADAPLSAARSSQHWVLA